MSRLWDPCCQCLSVSCMAAKVPLLLEQTSGSASGLMTPQPIRLRKMLIWGWGCMQHWALHKVRMAISTLNYNNCSYIYIYFLMRNVLTFKGTENIFKIKFLCGAKCCIHPHILLQLLVLDCILFTERKYLKLLCRVSIVGLHSGLTCSYWCNAAPFSVSTLRTEVWLSIKHPIAFIYYINNFLSITFSSIPTPLIPCCRYPDHDLFLHTSHGEHWCCQETAP